MAVLPLQLARVSNLLRTSVTSRSISHAQSQLLRVQNELTTGLRLNAPSDDPGDSAMVIQMQKSLERRQAYADNITHAKNQLSRVDSSLGDLTDLLRQADQIASANVGSSVSADARLSASAIVESLYNQALTNANTEFEGVYLFAGDRSTSPPFVAQAGGVKFVGSANVLENVYDEHTQLEFMVSGQDVFGAVSERLTSTRDLDPDISASTRLSDLNGASGTGVYKGSIQITNGGSSAIVDLSKADTVGDVITQINAVTGTTSVTASLAADGNSIQLTAGAGTFTVTEVASGTTATDLGILQAAPVASLDGADVNAKVTDLTPISALGGGAGIGGPGFRITNGLLSADIDLTGVATVQDLVNKINASGTHVLARINAEGTGIEIRNPVQGTDVTVSELGGTTAAALGIRSFHTNTSVGDLNGGKGIGTVSGPEMRVTRKDGTSFDVDLDGAATIADVISAINTAAGSAMATFATTGNGIVLTDASVGADTFRVEAQNFSTAAKDLGLDVAVSGSTITGRDANPVQSTGVFTNLAKLRDALRSSDQPGITQAAEALKADLDRIVRIRGTTGARVMELETREKRLEDENLATQTLLSSLQDTDYTEAISRFTMIQTSLQAGLQTANKVANLSLLDFLG